MTQDTNATGGVAIKRYKIGYHTDEWGVRSSTPGGITDPSGQWVLYKDHIAALASHGQAPAQAAPSVGTIGHIGDGPTTLTAAIAPLLAGKAAPETALAQLRHLYTNLKNGGVRDTAQAKRIADSLLWPVIETLEMAQAAPAAVAGPVAWYTDWHPDGRKYAAEPHGFDELGVILNDPDLIREVWHPLYAAPTNQPAPADPMDWPLPCNLTAGGVTIGKGCTLRTVQIRLQVQSETNALLMRKLSQQPAPQQEAQEPVDSMGMPLSCGKPLCAPGNHHPLCKLAPPPPAHQPQPSPASQGDALDAARYRWLFGARTDDQAASVTETVFKPLPQDEVLSHLQGFYMSKAVVDALVDKARKQGGA